MNPDKQRIAIAEACPGLFERNGGRFNAGWDLRWRASGASVDPLSDLNAMHEAEKLLIANKQVTGLATSLCHVCARDPMTPVWHATAAQRAEAFLKAKGLWKPDAV